MEYTLYRLQDSPQMHISIAYEVDAHFWKERRITTARIAVTKSMSQAFQWRKKGYCSKDDNKNDSLNHRPQTVNWENVKEQAKCIFPYLYGRSLLWGELLACLKKHKREVSEMILAQVIQFLYLNRAADYTSGVRLGEKPAKWICHRCLSTYASIVETTCATCEETCAYCKDCLMLGRSRACCLFITFKNMTLKPIEIPPSPLTLSKGQNRVCENINLFLKSTKTHCLVWAVTGAGKTEMMIPFLRNVLCKGKRVLWVTPRKDVVMEVSPRLRRFFPSTPIVELYGGSQDLWGHGNLVVSTAHQVLRYSHTFDYIIVDEVDAFPLYGNLSLESGIRRAACCGAKYIYLTATPSFKWQKYVNSSFVTYTLPVRYHGNPLPVPQMVKERSLKKMRLKGKKLESILHFIRKVMDNNGQAFIFVPRTKDVEDVLSWLGHHGVDEWNMEGVCSHDANRVDKVKQFRQGKIQFLVTTTILERGVTVARGFVLVLESDHAVFDASSLIQIAGRVGRSAEYQRGEVWFIGCEKTESQTKAIKTIRWLNQKAEKEGFLRKESYIQ